MRGGAEVTRQPDKPRCVDGTMMAAEGRYVLCYGAPANQLALRRVAEVMGRLHQADVVSLPRMPSPAAPAGRGAWRVRPSPVMLPDGLDAVRAWIGHTGVRGLVADWAESPQEVQETLAVASRLKVPACIVRHSRRETVRRLVVATAGGVHAMHVLSLAQAMAREWSLPAGMLRIEPRPGTGRRGEERRKLAALLARTFGMDLTIEVGRGADIVRQIDAYAGPDDLLIMGAPHFGIATRHFAGSLPEQLARRRVGPLVMCLAESPKRMPFRDFIWEDNICLGVRCRTRDETIALLAEKLVAGGVVPRRPVAGLLRRALEREAFGATAVGCESALPHIMLPGYDGVVAALAVCPEGIPFGDDGEKVRFVFLLVSSELSHERYLSAVACIARRMLHEETRRELLACATPAEALAILEHRAPQESAAVPAALTAGG